MTPARLVTAVIVTGTLMRIILSMSFGLGVDESYEVAIGRAFSLSYFEHPPLSFWIVGAAAKLAGSEARTVVRLPFILLFAGTTWLMFRVGARLFGEWAGAWAAVLVSVSLVFSVTSGGWVLPDGPLMFNMMAAVYCLTRALFDVESPTHHSPRPTHHAGTRGTMHDLWWLGAGVFTGLAMLSKYHGVFVAAGTFAFLVTTQVGRRKLATPGPWLAMMVAVLVCSPVIVWNSQHDWISFRFQGGRGVPAGLHLKSLLTNIGGQAFYLLPWIWVPLVWVLVRTVRAGPRDERAWLLACIGAGPIALFTLAALGGNPGLPHWQAPGYLVLFPLLGAWVAKKMGDHKGRPYSTREDEGRPDSTGDEKGRPYSTGDHNGRGVRVWLGASVALFVVFVAVAGSHLATGWAMRTTPPLIRGRDPGREMIDWRGLESELRARGLGFGPQTFAAATDWIDAGKLAYALGPAVPVLCLCAEPHHFALIRDQRAFLGQDAIVVYSGAPVPVQSLLSPYFRSVDSVGTVPIRRAGRIAMDVTVYVAHEFARPLPFRGFREGDR